MIIRWYRSWPRRAGINGELHFGGRTHAHVVDHLPRIEIEQYDYLSSTAGLPPDRPGFCLLEWDIALESSERRRFAEVAAITPDQILVAPYNLYPRDGNPEWAHRYEGGSPVRHGSPVCDTFGLGCIYLPQSIVADYLRSDTAAFGMTDASLSRFVRDHYGPTHIDWTFAPQHLSGD